MHLFSRHLTLYLQFSACLRSAFKVLLRKLLTVKIRLQGDLVELLMWGLLRSKAARALGCTSSSGQCSERGARARLFAWEGGKGAGCEGAALRRGLAAGAVCLGVRDLLVRRVV